MMDYNNKPPSVFAHTDIVRQELNDPIKPRHQQSRVFEPTLHNQTFLHRSSANNFLIDAGCDQPQKPYPLLDSNGCLISSDRHRLDNAPQILQKESRAKKKVSAQLMSACADIMSDNECSANQDNFLQKKQFYYVLHQPRYQVIRLTHATDMPS